MRSLIVLVVAFAALTGISGCGEKAAVTPSKIGDPSKDAGSGVEAKLPPPPGK